MNNYSSIDADMDTFFDFNQGVSTAASSQSPTSTTSSMHRPFDYSSQKQVFGGPSHEYGRFKQQTGLPNGAVSNVIAYNDMESPFSTSPSFNYGVEDLSQESNAYNSGISMDMDFAPSNMQSYMFMDGGSSSAFDDFVDPSALAESTSAPPPPPAASRPYPGMHSQAAQQSKAQAMAQQQKQQMQGQQIMQQRMQQQRGSISSNRSSVSQQGGAKKTPATPSDPHVEESISRVLEQMRHNSKVSTIDEEDEDEFNEGQGRNGRQKKDEDELDEDERLLASEEGKKLTSKERRQLRNKVSARAFRSRRKEYISQLEGEVAAKSNECNDLRAQNRNLMDQNSQLTRLTQTLLRHPAFATFLDDMSNDPSLLASLQTQAQASQQHDESSQQMDETPTKQDPEVEEHNAQVGMAMMPHTSLDFSVLNLGNAHWNGQSNQAYFQQPQVYAVYDLPEGPTIDQFLPRLSNLSGKEGSEAIKESKVDYPVIESPPLPLADDSKILPSVHVPSTEESSDSLYADSIADPASPPACTLEVAARLLECSLNGKVPVHFDMITLPSTNPDAAIQQIEKLFAPLEPIYRRVEALTAHLPR